jgi:hypothetical protein
MISVLSFQSVIPSRTSSVPHQFLPCQLSQNNIWSNENEDVEDNEHGSLHKDGQLPESRVHSPPTIKHPNVRLVSVLSPNKLVHNP